ncbi:SMI1/KNR4 family protein [Paenibacillus sp. GCM10027628]|uniref:SMI1/KNR4 family protein n=1 Tax=Paenibacillus sp. GCM10027628 TaxID=3273413 RepID=UPI00363A7BAA
MWMELIKRYNDMYRFIEPCTEDQLLNVEKTLNVEFPMELSDLLLESDGVQDQYGCDIIWSLERIEKDNIAFRVNPDFKDLYMPFDHLLFFSDAGNGDQFAFAILNGKITKNDIYVWNHEDDSRSWISGSLNSFINGWLSGAISV